MQSPHTPVGVVLRTPRPEDGPGILALKKEILAGDVFDALLPEEYGFNAEDEEAWVNVSLEDPNHFIAVCVTPEDEIVGILYFQSSAEKRCQHWGEFGMGVAATWRGKGLGKLLLQALFDWAKAHPTLEKVCLKVFAANKGAHKLYQKLGFVEEGCLKNCLKLKEGVYTDAILMAKFVKNKNGKKR